MAAEPGEYPDVVQAGTQPHRVEMRCPSPYGYTSREHPGKLLGAIEVGSTPSLIQPDNLIELACKECRRRLLAQGRKVARVLHRYNFAGEPVQTLIEEMSADSG